MLLRSIGAVASRGLGLLAGPRRARSRSREVVGEVATSEPSPVVLVHGYLDTLKTPWWGSLTEHLLDAGWSEDRIYEVETGILPGTTVGSPRQYARDVEATVERAHDAHGEPVGLLAHSMGGLNARWYVEQEGGAPLVDDVVTLGTPHGGTYAAYLGMVTAGCRSMVPTSSFIETLNDDGLEPSVRYTAVGSRGDRAVVPSSSALIPDGIAADDTRNIGITSRSHVGMLDDPRVAAAYVERLA